MQVTKTPKLRAKIIEDIDPDIAISVTGRDVTNLDSISELSHRLMLTNVLRMLGRIKTFKEERGKVSILIPRSDPGRVSLSSLTFLGRHRYQSRLCYPSALA